MPNHIVIYLAAGCLFFVGLLLVKYGLSKRDIKSSMQMVHYRPIRNYGKRFSIFLGVLCLTLSVLLLAL